MRIENAAIEDTDEGRRVAADVVWEDVDRPRRRIHVETRHPWTERLSPHPHTFLLAAAIPALRAGEARIAFQGTLCPELRDGLAFAMKLLSQWYDPGRRLPRLEPSAGVAPAPRAAEPRTLSFLSGGVDALALLRGNRLDHPREHPHSIRDGILVEGFEISAPGAGDQSEFFERAVKALDPVVQDTGIGLIPVRTNLRELDDGLAWLDEWLACGSAAVAHAFASHYDRALLAGGLEVASLMPHGTHPLLDPSYGSAGLSFTSPGSHLRRLDKVRLIGGWDAALRSLRVCWQHVRVGAPLNCGRCHKCVMTGIELLVVGKLRACTTLPFDDVTEEMAEESLRAKNASSLGFFRELIEPCEDIGRPDLARVLRRKILRIRLRNLPGVPRLGPLRRRLRRARRRGGPPAP